MKALLQDRYGSPETLRWAEVPDPVPGAGEVLVRVRAGAFNFADRVDLLGEPLVARLAFGVRRPRVPTPGRAFAGTIVDTGEDVLAEVPKRGWAELIAVPRKALAVKPAEISFEQAATIPLAGTTALQALRRAGLDRVRGGRVLVNGASGAVGSFAVQLVARRYHGRVTGVCSARNVSLVRSLGAEQVVDYTSEDLAAHSGRYDAVVDLAGSHSLATMRRLLAPGGVYIASFGTGGRVLGPLLRFAGVLAGGSRLRLLTARPDAVDLAEVAALVADGTLTPPTARAFPISGALIEKLSRLARGGPVSTG